MKHIKLFEQFISEASDLFNEAVKVDMQKLAGIIIKEETTYDKASKGDYLEKYNKKGELVLTAEKFSSGNWVVHEYPGYYGAGLAGEYTDTEFKKIKKYFVYHA